MKRVSYNELGKIVRDFANKYYNVDYMSLNFKDYEDKECPESDEVEHNLFKKHIEFSDNGKVDIFEYYEKYIFDIHDNIIEVIYYV